jgi:hypothetical protein
MGRLLAEGLEVTQENQHTINALIRKRAEIAGQIENLQGQLKKAVVDLDNVEATLRLFAPQIDMVQIGARRVPTAHHAFRGEVSRIVLEALRDASGPLTTTELTRAGYERPRASADDGAAGRRVPQSLAVRSMPTSGPVLAWEVVR